MRRLLFLTILSFFTLSVAAQENFQWKGLKFQTSSIQDAINSLGKPKKDKIEKARFDKEIPPDVRSQINLRKLQYQEIDGFEDIYLLFINEKLSGFEFTPQKKKSLASDLSKTYNSEFLFMEGLPKQMKYSDYEGQKEPTIPKVYPGNYFMLSVKPDCAIIATIDNNSWKALWRDGIKKPTEEMFPGYVRTIQIVSRNFDGK